MKIWCLTMFHSDIECPEVCRELMGDELPSLTPESEGKTGLHSLVQRETGTIHSLVKLLIEFWDCFQALKGGIHVTCVA